MKCIVTVIAIQCPLKLENVTEPKFTRVILLSEVIKIVSYNMRQLGLRNDSR